MQPIKLNTGEELDPQVVNLMRSVREKESGGNYNAVGDHGTSTGAFQFQAPTWQRYAGEVLGDGNAEQSRGNQTKVAYTKMKKWKDAGKSPEWIAAAWNSGEGKAESGAWKTNKGTTTINGKELAYDTPQYVADVIAIAKRNKQKMQAEQGHQPQDVSQETAAPQEQGGHQPWFKYNEGDGALVAGAKALGNTPQSAGNFAKGLIQGVNPVNTVSNLSQASDEFGALKEQQGGFWNAVKATLKEVPKATYETLVPQGIRQAISGDVQGAAKTFTEDPFGQAAPVVLAAVGGAKGLDKKATKGQMKGYVENIAENVKNREPIPTKPVTKYSDMVDTGIQKTAGLITKPVGAIGGKIGDVAKNTSASLLSKFTGMNPETIAKVFSDPKNFSKLAREETSRGGLANEVKSAIDSRLDELKENGAGYDVIRKSGETVTVPPSLFADVLKENRLDLKGGKIKATTESTTRNPSDIKAIQTFYDTWAKRRNLSANEFLNMRSDLAELAKYDKLTGMGKTIKSQEMAATLRARANNLLRDQLTGLKALDDVYAPEVQFLKQVKKDFVDRDGNLKDNAPSRIANSPNKAELTNRLKKLIPDIEQRIEILKATEDIERAAGIKVGAYGTMAPAAIGLLTSGPVGAIIAQIIASPQNAVSILRAAGAVNKATLIPIIKTLKLIGGDVSTNNPKLPSPFTTAGLIGKNTEINQ